ncbi:MAG: UDP-2,3-diacylglucosamine diphosphatase [Planctomycetota bacterium]
MNLTCSPTGLRVLGTEIFDVGGDERPTIVLSDLHVPADGGAVSESLAKVLDDAAAQRARVLVLGDLFDSYVTKRQLRTGVWQQTAIRFAAAVRAGAAIAVLHGNRDFLLGSEWTDATGALVVRGGIRTVLAGQRALLLHGDELCQNDLPYQRAKRWLRRPLVRAIARRLPLGLALRVAERARRRSQTVIQSGDQTRFLPTSAAVAAAFDTGVEVLVFGHIHRRCAGPFRGGNYWVLPAFDQEGVHLRTGRGVAFVALDGRPLVEGASPLPGLVGA